ncbi:hypothetical protein Ae201684P_018503 [Aphanomyces euteiches]|uniref:Tetraspanin n=1 Tax=Aphanomyces euteiches TaxID=100861 RepID=A0A6G0WZP2_9STRA|nr:hypothetical protein Ae201684_010088 [Aphanomyces euteiches]KAH9099489.1 hypothetical protein Ae201684P_018503 [Aphanomyces euteiches]KAH9154518.1 hypothetical protein AeRB84_003398 [Aphanomyces euteiches]
MEIGTARSTPVAPSRLEDARATSPSSRQPILSYSRVSEFDFKPYEKPTVLFGLAKVTVMLVNVAFVIIAGMLIYFTSWIRSMQVVEMFNTEYAWISNVTLVVLLVFGALVVVTSLVGCLGAWARNRHMLLGYVIIQCFVLVFFVGFSVGGFLSLHLVRSWEGNAEPNAVELSIPTQFNPLFCQSQVAYYCSVLGSELASKLGHVFDQLYGWNNACNSSLVRITEAELSAKMNATCALCQEYPVAKYNDFIISVASACPLTPSAANWCKEYFTHSSDSSREWKDTPYGVCRGKFLQLWHRVSKWIAWSAMVVAIFSLAITVLAVRLRHLVSLSQVTIPDDLHDYRPMTTPVAPRE